MNLVLINLFIEGSEYGTKSEASSFNLMQGTGYIRTIHYFEILTD